MPNPNDVAKTRMLQDERRVATCDRCIIGLGGIERIYEIRRESIPCGFKNCKKMSSYEVELQF